MNYCAEFDKNAEKQKTEQKPKITLYFRSAEKTNIRI